MYEVFLKLPDEKRLKIINAALKVFSNTSYKKAATDDIVKYAGISKGSLFHYFQNKENLYLYLYDYVISILLMEFYDKIDLKVTDIFERFYQIMLIKLDLSKRYPDLFNFILNVTYDQNELKSVLEIKEKQLIEKNMNILLKDIDKSKFRNDIDPDMAIKMIILFFDGYGRNESLKLKRMGNKQDLYDIWIKEISEYIIMMKKIYYKGE
jgi:AcrR family transcriptional regulator